MSLSYYKEEIDNLKMIIACQSESIKEWKSLYKDMEWLKDEYKRLYDESCKEIK